MLALGIDTAYRRTGWAVIGGQEEEALLEASGVILSKGSSRGERLLSIERQFSSLVERWQPNLVVLEMPGKWMTRQGSSRNSVELLAMARGLMLKHCAEAGVTAVEVDFNEVRQCILGKANAGKPDVIRFLLEEGFNLPVNRVGRIDDDIADAVMLGLLGLSHTLT